MSQLLTLLWRQLPLVVIALIPLLLTLNSVATERPNILVLMAEDMSSRVGAFDDPVAITPHLDALAAAGVRYPNTFTTAGVCAPSRAAHITGVHQMAMSGQHMRSSTAPTGGYLAEPPAMVKAYPELLRANGYYTWTDNKLDYQFSGVLAGSGPFTIWNHEGDQHWRQRELDQPFFGLINFQLTHESGVFTPLGQWPHSISHAIMQLVRAITLPRVSDTSPVSPDRVQLPPYYADTPLARADLARHYNNIHAMDQQVGALLAQLEADGLADSTIVIWTTDHGDGLPRAKRELFDSGIKVPLIIRWPPAYRPAGLAENSVDSRLVSLVDFAPTLLALAGVKPPAYLHGSDFTKASQRQYVFAARDRIDEVYDRQRAVRDQRFKYIRSWYPEIAGGQGVEYRDNIAMMRELRQLSAQGVLSPAQQQWFEPVAQERLYDTYNDPFELTNIATDPAYQKPLHRLRTALTDWQQRVGDGSELSESAMVAAFAAAAGTTTAAPQFTKTAKQLILSSKTEGASIGYRRDGGEWQIYRAPLEVTAKTSIVAKAVRYGWLESAAISWPP
jgi:arylsulfatase A-like enzyme